MKKTKRMIALLAAAAMLFLAGCTSNNAETEADPQVDPGQETQETQEEQTTEPGEAQDPANGPNYEALYAGLLDRLSVIAAGIQEEEYPEDPGVLGIYETAQYMESEDALASMGFSMEDISGDGVPELLVGPIAEVGGSSSVFAGYTLDEQGNPVCFLEGWSRNRYDYLGDGRFVNSGSAGAMSSCTGYFHVSEDGQELICDDFYFTAESPENPEEIAVYHNTTGSWDEENSERLEMDVDGYWEIQDDALMTLQFLDYTPFSTLPRG